MWTTCWRSASPPRRPPESGSAAAIIAAAGSGERLGAGGPKAFIELAGRPLVEWALDAFRLSSSIGQIVVAVPPGHESQLAGAGVGIVTGGAHRSESVRNALERVEAQIAVVHDAARPLVTPELIDAIVGELAERTELAGLIAASPVADTVKLVGDGGMVLETPDRSALWAAQTPQAFRVDALREALAGADLEVATDDAMLVERAGGTVAVHEAPAENLKVTTADDLRLVELLLRGPP